MIRNSYIMLIAVGALLATSPQAFAVEVKLRERVVSGAAVVRLGDVAEVVTADAAEQRRLAGLLLMPAPAPGTQRFVRQREIQDMLAAHGEDVARLQIAGANQIAIVSPSAAEATDTKSVAGGTIDRQAVLLAGQVKRQAAGPKEEATFDDADAARVRDQLNRIVVAYLTAKAGRGDAWRVTLNVADRFLTMVESATTTPTCMGGLEPWTGRQRFVVSFSTAKGTMQIPVYADVALATPVVVAIRPIGKGGVITAAHVEMQTIDYVPAPSGRRVLAESVEKLIGMEAEQAIKAGETIFTDQVRAPLLIVRGEEITVVAQGNGIRVRTMARAAQDGALGELVQVETLDKKERYDARVIGARKVAVFVTPRPAAEQPKFERTETARR